MKVNNLLVQYQEGSLCFTQLEVPTSKPPALVMDTKGIGSNCFFLFAPLLRDLALKCFVLGSNL